MGSSMATLPFLDDFSLPGPYPDTSKWIDKKVYVNYGNPVCPHTLGVATFDGLDSVGMPYNRYASPGSSAPADFLTSKPIHWNIPGFTPALKLSDSIYFSFYYQSGTYFGNDVNGRSSLGYWPKESDTLLLQFRAGGDTLWHTMWYHLGYAPTADTDTVFHMVMLPINSLADTMYLRDGFQFRFMNYACGSGDADHWSIDEVYLNQNRNYHDTMQDDITFAYEAPSMLANYTAEPWEQYKIGDLRTTPMRLFERNNWDSGKIINATYNYTINTASTTTYSGGAYNVYPYVDSLYNKFAPQALPPLLTGKFPTTPLTGPTTYTITHSLSNIGDFDPWNDTLRYNQIFSDYYAYDDGSPEAAYYVQGFGTLPTYLVTQFKFNNPDTIMGMRIYFDYLFVNSGNYTFKMMVWNDNGGSPGDTIYVDDTIVNPSYNFTGNDLYTGYFFRKNVPVKAGTYYVGWELTYGDSINVGIDLNNHNGNKIFYCIDPFAKNLTWYNSTFDGSLMVRPIMASPTLVAGVNNIDAPANEITLYPNPAKNEVMLSGNLHNALVRIMGADGRVLYTDEHYSGNSINTSTLPNGFYLVQITTEKGETTFKKLLISK